MLSPRGKSPADLQGGGGSDEVHRFTDGGAATMLLAELLSIGLAAST
jgi:hypothetical protein